ncbi:hypothetical protein Pmani_038151 [Petrolisthes manimaculis]|uniref:Uncharacterized protein n=1 Tax=Petrolisthes manimaculis TaxID=1843537 RepID=A0AAE1TML1_9EUCA|nr:hypothetical protein Pmani_038151 [Petrolisthes manimaculis]
MRYMKYFQGTPRAKHKTEEERQQDQEGCLRVPPSREMLEAEERFLNYFKPVPSGPPRQLSEPPISESDRLRQSLLKEYWEVMETKVERRERKIIKVSRPRRELPREPTPPSQRDLVVAEFLERGKTTQGREGPPLRRH